jgi:hypothetical protein
VYRKSARIILVYSSFEYRISYFTQPNILYWLKWLETIYTVKGSFYDIFSLKYLVEKFRKYSIILITISFTVTKCIN